MAAAPAPMADLTSMWDVLPGMVLRVGDSGDAIDANARFAAFFGFGSDPVTGQRWQGLFAEASRLALCTALTEHQDFRLQLEWRGADAASGWIECAARWVAEEDCFVCLLHDVTDATEARTSAHSQLGLLRLLADNVPVLIAYYRAVDMRCQFANKAYARAFGRDEHSIVGVTFADVVGEETARQISHEVDTVLQGLPVNYERTMKSADGRTRWIEVHLLPHLGLSRETLGAYVLISDITKHREAEHALRESEERLAKFMQATAEGIVFHKGGVIVDANPPVCELIGYSLEELFG
ncbi:MAG: PAS domain S-box protein, partial [Caldimonas sp.]